MQCATANPDGQKRALVIGGGIANFTDVAATFSGIIQALKEKVSVIWVNNHFTWGGGEICLRQMESQNWTPSPLVIKGLIQVWSVKMNQTSHKWFYCNLFQFAYSREIIDCCAIANQEAKLKAARMHIYVRRGGPNYQKGLAKMRALGEEIGIPIEVEKQFLIW